MSLADTAELAVRINLSGNATAGIDKLTRKVNGLGGSVARAGRGVGQIGASFAKAGLLVGGAAVGGLAAAAKFAIEWEDAFAGVRKTIDEADLTEAGLSFRDLELSLRKMSTTMPVAATDLAAIAEAAGAMGVAGKDIEEFTRVVAILGSTTNVSVEDAATALGQMQNVIGLTAAEYDNFAASLVDLGNQGNSTEAQILEIARRSGGAAKFIGVATEATLAWAAAAANLGLNEELAGTGLQNFFLKTQTAITAGGADFKELAKVSGQTTKEFKKSFDEDASGALERFLGNLGKMSKDARLKTIQDIFGKGSGLTRLIVGLADSIAINLTPSLHDGVKAWRENTAAQEEFDKRNATVRSGITRLRNGLEDALVTIGEGFTPALGRATDKLSAFLAQDANRSALKTIGEDIGRAIDGIDWAKVLAGAREFVGVMKSAVGLVLQILGEVNKLPTEIKAFTAALLALNKASGGLLVTGGGNVIGGVVESLGSRAPVVGRLFAQPVFVTNFPLGFGAPPGVTPGVPPGGAPKPPGGRFVIRGGGTAGAGAFIDMAVLGEYQDIVRDAIDRGAKGPPSALGEMRTEFLADLAKTTAAAQETARETNRGASLNAATTRTGSASIVGAIIANRPIVTTNVDVNVSGSAVSKSITVSERYGPSGGSRSRDAGGPFGGGR